MKTTLLIQLRKRRKALGLQIQDMPLLAGLTRQQYGKIEAGGNPRLNTLDQMAEALESVLVLVPKSKLAAVERILANETLVDIDPFYFEPEAKSERREPGNDDENPWGNI